MPSVACVDLFCGVGGLTDGFRKSGIDVRAGVDVDQSCAWPYEHNTGARFVSADVASLPAGDVDRLLADTDFRVLAGCAPCQPFSSYSQGRRSDDGKWRLLGAFARLTRESKPDFVSMENVVGLARHPIFKDFVTQLEADGYSVAWGTLDCQKFSVPQTRKRLVLIGSRHGQARLPDPGSSTPRKSVRDAIGALPPLSAGEVCRADPLHQAASLSRLNLQRIRHSTPGGSWRDWPDELVTACHRVESGRTYPSVYGRMEWDKPSPTITTQCYGYGNGRFGHPEQDRAISLREAALLQSFPGDWLFSRPGEPIRFAPIGRIIGNAVPPVLAEAIGRTVRQLAEDAA